MCHPKKTPMAWADVPDQFTAAQLMTWDIQPPTTADILALIDGGECTAQCILGTEVGPCECRCGGKFHAAAR